MPTRRSVLATGATLTLLAPFARLAAAGATSEARFVLVILRGGLDGLAAVPPYAEPRYAELRGPLALGAPGSEGGALDLDGTFGLHPALTNLHEWYRAGETERAKQLMRRLDALFGRGARPPKPGYEEENIDLFVKNETYEAWEGQPWAAPRDVSATLEYGFKMGVFGGEKGVEVLRNALRFANDVTVYFKNNEYYQSATKFGSRRIADVIGVAELQAGVKAA